MIFIRTWHPFSTHTHTHTHTHVCVCMCVCVRVLIGSHPFSMAVIKSEPHHLKSEFVLPQRASPSRIHGSRARTRLRLRRVRRRKVLAHSRGELLPIVLVADRRRFRGGCRGYRGRGRGLPARIGGCGRGRCRRGIFQRLQRLFLELEDGSDSGTHVLEFDHILAGIVGDRW